METYSFNSMNVRSTKLTIATAFVLLSALSAQKSAGCRYNQGLFKKFRLLKTAELWCAGITYFDIPTRLKKTLQEKRYR